METAYFRDIRRELLSSLATSEKEIRIAVAWFTNKELFDVLIDKLKSQVKVTVAIIDDYINNGDFGLNFQEFIDNGGILYYGKDENPMHHKFCLIDDIILFTGSYNWTYYAESKNFENVVKFEGDSGIITTFTNEFDDLITHLDLAKFAKKLTIGELEEKSSLRSYVGFDLLYKGKELSSTIFLNQARELIPSNAILIKELDAFPLAAVEIKSFDQMSSPERKILPVKAKIANYSIGIKSRINGKDGRFSCIVPKGAKIPCKLSHTYRTVSNNQTQMQIETYKGESDIADKNIRLGKFLISDLPKRPAGVAGVTITINLNANNILTVTAKSEETGNQMEVDYPDNTLSLDIFE